MVRRKIKLLIFIIIASISLNVFISPNAIAASTVSVLPTEFTWVGPKNATLATTTGWTQIVSNSYDDEFQYLSLGASFNVGFEGFPYNCVEIHSNTYLAFQTSCTTDPANQTANFSDYSGLTPSNPAKKAIHMCSADNSYQKVFYKYENSNTQLRIRYEGNNSTSGTVGTPTIVYEALLTQNSGIIDIGIGIHSRCDQNLGLLGVTTGTDTVWEGIWPSAKATYTSGSYTITSATNVKNTDYRISSGPAVSTFSSTQQSPTNTNSGISYSLIMSESVTGMESADFENAGTATSCSFSVSGSGATYTLTVSSCSEGTLQPRLKANTVTGSSLGPISASAATSTIVIDRTVPTISTVSAPNNATYKPADTPTFTIAFSESVTVTGTPRLTLTVGALTRYATYVSQTDSRTALFRYTVVRNTSEFDTDGISISNTIDLNSGSISDLASNALASLTFSAPNTSSIFVAQPPAAPTIDSATAGSTFIRINFTAGSTYGSPITNYQYSTDNGSNWSNRSPVDTSTPLTIPSLTNGTSYTVRIRAVSAVGNSDSSTSITATPNAVTVAGGSNITTTFGRSASSTTFTSSGGVSPYVYTLTSTVTGITISNGVVTTSTSLPAGTYSLNVVSTDAFLANGTKAITITVSKATQDTLTVTSSNGVFNGNPSSFYLATSGGTDTGTVTYSVVAGGTASGCSISGGQLTVNTAGTCKVVATKAATNNYLIAYSDTATITFSQFISYQPVQTQSTPSQIPISGQNSLDLSQSATVPAVTGVFLVGSTYEINGTGFTGVTRVVIGGADISISSSTATKIVINSAGLFPGPLFIECSDGRIGPSPFYFFVP
jgi:Fibronectin type III domain